MQITNKQPVLDCFSVAIKNTMNKRHMERKGFIWPSGWLPFIKEGQGRSWTGAWSRDDGGPCMLDCFLLLSLLSDTTWNHLSRWGWGDCLSGLSPPTSISNKKKMPCNHVRKPFPLRQFFILGSLFPDDSRFVQSWQLKLTENWANNLNRIFPK